MTKEIELFILPEFIEDYNYLRGLTAKKLKLNENEISLVRVDRRSIDARSNVSGVTKKDRPLTAKHFEEFEKCYGADPNGTSKRKDLGEEGRFRKFSLKEIKERDYKLDISWIRDESLENAEDLPEPQDLAAEAITELEAVVDDLKDILETIELNGNSGIK